MQRTPQGIDSLANNMKNNKAKVLLGFNEPDIAAQANISPDTAVQLWRKHILPIKGSLRFGSPAVSNGANGLPWLKEFMSKCTDCSVDFIACHWYGPDFSNFESYVKSVIKSFPGKKIWITEFALELSASQDQQNSFIKKAQKFLDGQSEVERYSWFGAFRGKDGNNLITSDGKLTPVGSTYLK